MSAAIAVIAVAVLIAMTAFILIMFWVIGMAGD